VITLLSTKRDPQRKKLSKTGSAKIRPDRANKEKTLRKKTRKLKRVSGYVESKS